MSDFEVLLDRYADLLVSWALNIQPGQSFYINAEPIHRHFCGKLVKRAYEKGAKLVHVSLNAPEYLKYRIEGSRAENDLTFVPKWLSDRYREMVDENSASLRLVGSEDPQMLSELDPKKINLQQVNFRKAIKYYYEEGVGKSKVAWNVAAHATPVWGQKLFPELSGEEACKLLWEELFKICRVDREDYLEEWKQHNGRLKKRAKALDNLKIEKLHFIGPGTDLKVFLSREATFRGGGDLSSRGVLFEPNIPTEECFTTPDCRSTEGKARVTRPVLVNGKLVRGLEIEFAKGELVHFSAEEGEATFREYIESDPGARRLGEVALVGIDSPIYQSGRVFQEILLDENAACHIAIGFAYTFCIKGGENKSRQELDALGANQSACHLDMMISDDAVDVLAETYEGRAIPIIRKGSWII
jgi:aminopeptidase